VTLAAPGRLALVILPIVLLIAYLVLQHRRRAYAVRFTSVDLLASVAPRRPGWRRHVSAFALLLALLAMIVGLARPLRVEKVPKDEGTILLAIDTSGSMSATDVAPSRLAAAEEAARNFVEQLPPGLSVGLVSFDSSARLLVTPTTEHDPVLEAIDSLVIGGGTATADAIKQSLETIAAQPAHDDGTKPGSVVVLMSDGSPTLGIGGVSPEQSVTQQTAAAKEAGVPIDTIAFGTSHGTVERNGEVIPVPADPDAMEAIANGSDGHSFEAATGEELGAVYDQIRRTVGYDTEKHDVTVWWLALGFLLALGAATAGVVWMQRIP
jgi:Ca-activated chloride channel family protein